VAEVSSSDLVLSVAPEGDAVLVSAGDVDMGTVDRFEQALSEAIKLKPSEVRCSLRGVTFFGSEGVHALTEAHRLAVANQVRLTIVDASPIARRILEVSRLDHLAERP
jgi:anti-anti-sigma factor